MNQVGRIGVLGGGKMALAMVKGFLSAGLTKPERIIASVHPDDKQSFMQFEQIGIETVVKNEPVVEKSDIVLISVKPQVVPVILPEIRPLSNNKLFISIAMGITLQMLEEQLSSSARIIRAMPNTPALVKAGCSVYARGAKASQKDGELTVSLLEAIGTCEEVPEIWFDPITALSGSGPAYVFVMIEALADGGVRMGLPRDLAYRLAAQTVLGSGKLVLDTKEHPGVLKDNVTSPAGSTAAALKILETKGFRGTVANAVEAATLRCREISGN
ncbi:pyrroline-5-carboxylate reductase 1, mitochondrial [Bactrocera neohumeralis]|uniref:pyrroline-5-carboxylate reductase 1, mitochondrial n=1 Tax=Bactrocera tryoni TaxID=59916 RepID=UPI001A96F57F|nr:pyrroline-5-carboxylate reductase 1, mitochondrial [Bactrocera tryoni]XP_050318140.1 pyrroline-5-carboxylate reductase 1, mitochondrial [Bactrocera neohumeralis]